MRLGVTALLVLADPEVKAVVGHEGLDPTPAHRAAVVQRKVAMHHVRDEVGAAHGQAAHWVGLDLVTRFEEIIRPVEAVAKNEGVVEHCLGVVEHVHHIGRGVARHQQRAAGGGVDDAKPGVHGDGEHRTLLPLEHVLFGVALLPDFGRASAFNHQVNLLVHVLLRVQRAARRHLHHKAAPLGLCAQQLQKVATAPGALPG